MFKASLRRLMAPLACLCLLALLVPLTCKARPTAHVKGNAPPRKDCWVFHHMVKSGGTTVRRMLVKWARREHLQHGSYANAAWLAGDEFAKSFLDKGLPLMLGGYTEGLRAYGGVSDCKWFTIFRHPVERLVSAFFYCQYNPVDPLCAHEFLDASNVDLLAFAQHWGNYGLRQYVMPFMSLREITSSPAGKQCSLLGIKCPGWYLVKLHLEAQHKNETSMSGEALAGFLQPAQELLNSNYTAIGILEEFDTTVRLFNRALEMPKLDWQREFQLYGASNVDTTFHSQKDKALQEALVDSELHKFLSLDILLYEYALSVHKRQVALLM